MNNPSESERLIELERLLAQREEEKERLTAEINKTNQVNDLLRRAIENMDKYFDSDDHTPNE